MHFGAGEGPYRVTIDVSADDVECSEKWWCEVHDNKLISVQGFKVQGLFYCEIS